MASATSRSQRPGAPRNPLERRSTFMARWDLMQDDAKKEITSALGGGAAPTFLTQKVSRKKSLARALYDRGFSAKSLHRSATLYSSGIVECVDQRDTPGNVHSDRVYASPLSCIQRVLVTLFTTQQGFVSPSCSNLHRWSLLVSGFMVYLLICAPLRVATYELARRPAAVYLIVDTCAALVFTLDVIIRLHTGVVNPRTRAEDIQKLRARYARTRIVRDLLGCIPVELLGILFVGTNAQAKAVYKFISVLRLGRGTHVINLESTLAGEHFNLNRGIRRLIATVVFVPLMSHLLACTWIYLGLREQEAGVTDTWLELARESQPEIGSLEIFLASLEWSVSALSSVGFGEFTAANDTELFISIIGCILGAVLSGILIAQTSSIVSDMNETQHQINLRMSSLRAYLRYRRVPKSLQLRLLRYFRHLYTRRAHFDELNILENLTADLRRALSLYLLEDTLQDLDIFRGISDTQLVARLIAVLKPASVSPGTEIIRKGEPVTEMYFIVRGKVEVLADGPGSGSFGRPREGSENDASSLRGSQERKMRVIASLGAGNHFGELAATESRGANTHLVTVRAATSTDLFTLSQQHLSELANSYPLVKKRLRSFKQAKQAALEEIERENFRAVFGAETASVSWRKTGGLEIASFLRRSNRSSSGKSKDGSWRRMLNLQAASLQSISASFKAPASEVGLVDDDDDDDERANAGSGSVVRFRQPTFRGRNSRVYTHNKADELALLSVNMNLAQRKRTAQRSSSTRSSRASEDAADEAETPSSDSTPDDYADELGPRPTEDLESAGDAVESGPRDAEEMVKTADLADEAEPRESDGGACGAPAEAESGLEKGLEKGLSRTSEVGSLRDFTANGPTAMSMPRSPSSSSAASIPSTWDPPGDAHLQDLVRGLLNAARQQGEVIADLRAQLLTRSSGKFCAIGVGGA